MKKSWGFIGEVARRILFSPTRYNGGYSAGEISLRHAVAQTGSALDYENAAGDVLSNSIVAACVNAICQALPEAPILLEKRIGGNEFELVHSHAVLDLLHNPNPYLSEAELWGVTTAFERTRGEAFWYFEYDSSRTVPREIWFRAPEYVQVLSDTTRFISGYNITSESGQVVSLEECDVVHFRHQLSTLNLRAGWAPIQTGKRQIVGDNAAATYHSAILRNAGAASLIISLKDAAAAGEVTPGQIDEYVQLFKRKVVGEGSGAILGMDLPLDVHKVGFSPNEMALDRLPEYYESRICALLGVNRRVINLGNDPTYENSKVALNDFWERTIVPMRRRHASTLSSQLLPLFGLDPAVYRLRFDFSEVEALRENVDALHSRWRETFTAGGIDLFTFQEKIGLKPDESLRGRFVKASSPIDDSEAKDEIKVSRSLDWDESKHPRASDGRFGYSAGAPRQLGYQPISGESGTLSSGPSKNRGEVGQLYGKHREARQVNHDREGERMNLPVILGVKQKDIAGFIDKELHKMKSSELSAEKAREILGAFYDDNHYQSVKERAEAHKREIEYDNLDLEIYDLSPEEKKQTLQRIAKNELELDADEFELKNLYRRRYPQMWAILCANDSPKFDKAGFDISNEFNEEESKSLNSGINFLSRMIGSDRIPPTEDLKFRKTDEERSGYYDKAIEEWEANTIALAKGGGTDSVVHEMAHWLAVNNPELTQQLKWHHERRTKGERAIPLNQIDSKFKSDEYCKKDNFIDPYMGKFYRNGQNEILTVGLQYFILAPDDLAKNDPETFEFIYKLLRGKNPEVAPPK